VHMKIANIEKATTPALSHHKNLFLQQNKDNTELAKTVPLLRKGHITWHLMNMKCSTLQTLDCVTFLRDS
jgi:hypothetical protein